MREKTVYEIRFENWSRESSISGDLIDSLLTVTDIEECTIDKMNFLYRLRVAELNLFSMQLQKFKPFDSTTQEWFTSNKLAYAIILVNSYDVIQSLALPIDGQIALAFQELTKRNGIALRLKKTKVKKWTVFY